MGHLKKDKKGFKKIKSKNAVKYGMGSCAQTVYHFHLNLI